MTQSALAPCPPLARVLDVGAGDGWFASQFNAAKRAREVVAVDVQARPQTHWQVQLYDGSRLPFEDRTFDLVYAMDVLHHCPDPLFTLSEMLRSSREWLLLKDHTYRTNAGRLTLCALDEVGNRRFGIPSLYRYQHQWDWLPTIEAAGFVRQELLHPAACHTGVLGWLTNRLQFVGLWRRRAA